MKEELEKLLSCLHTDANLALNDIWDRGDEGFKAQIDLIEDFASKHDIILKDMTKPV